MSFDLPHSSCRRVAIIGGGISGLASGYLLGANSTVTVYEAEPRFGGHARTVLAGRNGNQPVDTGFIVFNYVNYPHLTRMFRDLNVPIVKSDMSFGVSVDDGRIEYALRNLSALTAQRRNLARPAFARLMRDIFRFNTHAEAFAISDDMTIGELISALRLGDWFERYYLLPICGAIWSTPPQGIRSFPARTLIRFFKNHALMSPSGQHQWWTVDGGSIEYVDRLLTHLRLTGVNLRPGTPVSRVERVGHGCMVHTAVDEPAQYDDVIFACHSDQALRLLGQPTPEEHAALSAIRYQDNHMVLHCDQTQMPHRKACWSSWVYNADTSKDETKIGVTYWMNKLQNIPESDPLFVTLNPVKPVTEKRVYDTKVFRHPVFDQPAIRGQQHLRNLNGRNNTWFAGAYTRNGFHEDGFASAVRIARALNRQIV